MGKKSWTSDSCREYASSHEGICSVGSIVIASLSHDDFLWNYKPDFEISHFLWSRGSAETWISDFNAERKAHSEDGNPDYYDDMIDVEIDDPIVCLFYSGKWHIQDGMHRVGSRFLGGYPSIPAVFGTPSDHV